MATSIRAATFNTNAVELDVESIVRFETESGATFSVRLSGDRLLVRAQDGALVVFPSSSNTFRVGVSD